MSDRYYVYIYLDTRDFPPAPMYIGKGTRNRAWAHLGKSTNILLNRKINSIRLNHNEPAVSILHDGLNQDTALLLENRLILQYSIAKLKSRKDNFKHSDDSKLKMSRQRKGRAPPRVQTVDSSNGVQ